MSGSVKTPQKAVNYDGLPSNNVVNLCQNSAGGFDIAELTHKNNAEPMPVQAVHISESAKKARLLLISNYDNY